VVLAVGLVPKVQLVLEVLVLLVLLAGLVPKVQLVLELLVQLVQLDGLDHKDLLGKPETLVQLGLEDSLEL
jgi:hypothetical protein